VRARTPRPV